MAKITITVRDMLGASKEITLEVDGDISKQDIYKINAYFAKKTSPFVTKDDDGDDAWSSEAKKGEPTKKVKETRSLKDLIKMIREIDPSYQGELNSLLVASESEETLDLSKDKLTLSELSERFKKYLEEATDALETAPEAGGEKIKRKIDIANRSWKEIFSKYYEKAYAEIDEEVYQALKPLTDKEEGLIYDYATRLCEAIRQGDKEKQEQLLGDIFKEEKDTTKKQQMVEVLGKQRLKIQDLQQQQAGIEKQLENLSKKAQEKFPKDAAKIAAVMKPQKDEGVVLAVEEDEETKKLLEAQLEDDRKKVSLDIVDDDLGAALKDANKDDNDVSAALRGGGDIDGALRKEQKDLRNGAPPHLHTTRFMKQALLENGGSMSAAPFNQTNPYVVARKITNQEWIKVQKYQFQQLAKLNNRNPKSDPEKKFQTSQSVHDALDTLKRVEAAVTADIEKQIDGILGNDKPEHDPVARSWLRKHYSKEKDERVRKLLEQQINAKVQEDLRQIYHEVNGFFRPNLGDIHEDEADLCNIVKRMTFLEGPLVARNAYRRGEAEDLNFLMNISEDVKMEETDDNTLVLTMPSEEENKNKQCMVKLESTDKDPKTAISGDFKLSIKIGPEASKHDVEKAWANFAQQRHDLKLKLAHRGPGRMYFCPIGGNMAPEHALVGYRALLARDLAPKLPRSTIEKILRVGSKEQRDELLALMLVKARTFGPDSLGPELAAFEKDGSPELRDALEDFLDRNPAFQQELERNGNTYVRDALYPSNGYNDGSDLSYPGLFGGIDIYEPNENTSRDLLRQVDKQVLRQGQAITTGKDAAKTSTKPEPSTPADKAKAGPKPPKSTLFNGSIGG